MAKQEKKNRKNFCVVLFLNKKYYNNENCRRAIRKGLVFLRNPATLALWYFFLKKDAHMRLILHENVRWLCRLSGIRSVAQLEKDWHPNWKFVGWKACFEIDTLSSSLLYSERKKYSAFQTASLLCFARFNNVSLCSAHSLRPKHYYATIIINRTEEKNIYIPVHDERWRKEKGRMVCWAINVMQSHTQVKSLHASISLWIAKRGDMEECSKKYIYCV